MGNNTRERLCVSGTRQDPEETDGQKLYWYPLTLNGEHFADFDATETRYTDKAWDGTRVELSVKGEGSCYYYWSAFGIQRDSFIEEYERELQVRRRYFNKRW